MKLFLLFVILYVFFAAFFAYGAENNIDINWHGFVRADMIFDSRESVTFREDAIMLFPKYEEFNIFDEDINDNTSMNMFVLHTRLLANIKGPEILGAESSARIEGEFFGTSDGNANGFRLRHSYINLKWHSGKSVYELLFGQYWNPLFRVQVVPNFNFCSPFIAYARNPQLKFSWSTSSINLEAVAFMQSDFKSLGPGADNLPTRSTQFTRNSSYPNFNVTAEFGDEDFFNGVGVSYSKIKPGYTPDSVQSEEMLHSFAGTYYAKQKFDWLTSKVQLYYGQNLADLTMLGGYGIRADDNRKYENINTLSGWLELSGGEKWVFSLMLGAAMNLGTENDIVIEPEKIYAFGWNLRSVARIAPSVIYQEGNLKSILEFEITQAEYGTMYDRKLDFSKTKVFTNARIDFACFYYF